jgi:YgiT-type zinc finger domain-containing protein
VIKECPMCGEVMRLETRDRAERLPGSRAPQVRQVQEWICPECDYFEDAGEAGTGR